MSVIIDLAGWRLTLPSHERAGQPLLMGYAAQAPRESAPLTLGGVRTPSANGSSGYRQGHRRHPRQLNITFIDGRLAGALGVLTPRTSDDDGEVLELLKVGFRAVTPDAVVSACPAAPTHLPT